MYVAQYPCLICGSDSVQVAHIRHLPSGNIGMGQKDDRYTVPLCYTCHSQQHGMNEKKFWQKYNINPMRIAKILCLKSPCNQVKEFLETTNYFKEGNYESQERLCSTTQKDI